MLFSRISSRKGRSARSTSTSNLMDLPDATAAEDADASLPSSFTCGGARGGARVRGRAKPPIGRGTHLQEGFVEGVTDGNAVAAAVQEP